MGTEGAVAVSVQTGGTGQARDDFLVGAVSRRTPALQQGPRTPARKGPGEGVQGEARG